MARTKRLSTKIMKWMAIMALGPLVVVAIQGYHCGRQAVIDSQKQHLLTVVRSRRSTLARWLDQRKKEISILSLVPNFCEICSNPQRKTGEENKYCNLMTFVKQSDIAYRGIALFDKSWNKVLDVEQTGNKAMASEDIPEEFRKRLSEKKGNILTSLQVVDKEEMELLIGKSFDSSDSDAKGSLVAILNLSATLKPLLEDRTGLGKTGKVYLLSPEGSYECLPSEYRSVSGKSAKLPCSIVKGMEEVVTEYKDFRGEAVVGGASWIPELERTVVAEIDQAEAFSWLHILRNRALSTGIVTFLLVIILSLKIAAHLSKPLKKLASVSQTIADGHHDVRLAAMEGAEAREVARAFNAMLDKIEATHKRLVQTVSLAAVGELSSSLVHEMRNPLSTVKINLQALQKKIGEDPAYQELANLALTQVSRLEKMFADLLGYGKPLELNPAPIRFSQLVKECMDFVKNELEGKKINIRIADLLGEKTFMADPEQIRRCMINLVLNAIQASPHQGEIVLTGKIPEQFPESVMMKVEDEGEGFSSDQKEHLFQPFYTTREQGTGLGLANVKKIVEYHQGKIFAENRPSGGAAFFFILPLKG